MDYTYTTGRLTSVTDANGGYELHVQHEPPDVDGDGPQEPDVPDEHLCGGHRLVAHHEPDPGGRDDVPVRVHGGWDGKGDPDGRDGPAGDGPRVTFNAAGYPLTDTRAHGQPEAQTTTNVRQAAPGCVTSVTDVLGRTTAFTYDTAGNVTTVTRLSGTPDAVTTTYTYEPTYQQVASVRTAEPRDELCGTTRRGT